MRPAEERLQVRDLALAGHSCCQIARLTGIPRSTLREWLNPSYERRTPIVSTCELCGQPQHNFGRLPLREYAYLLGVYLGDGTVHQVRGTRVLAIYMDTRYPGVIREVAEAMRVVLPDRRVGIYRQPAQNAVTIRSYCKSWACLIPQTGPGRKCDRKIELAEWQRAIVDRDPEQFVRGLIHSDGCRTMNRVVAYGNDYAYPRYFFTQVSKDIQGLFCRSLDQLGIEYGFSSRGKDVSIHRRASVARLDAFVGPKR